MGGLMGGIPPIAQRASVAALALLILSSGVVFNVQKNTPSGESATENHTCFSSTGSSSLCFRTNSNVKGSGSLAVQGTLSGKTVISTDFYAAFGSSSGRLLCVKDATGTLGYCSGNETSGSCTCI